MNEPTGFQPDLGTDRAPVRGLAHERETNPTVGVASVVTEELRGASVCGQDHVEVAVAVDVGIGAASADDRSEQVGAGGRFSDQGVQPPPLRAGVPEKLGGLGVGFAGLDLGDVAFEVAVGREQVKPPVEVVVEEEEAELERRLRRRAEAVDVGEVGELEPFRRVGHVERHHLIGEVADGHGERAVIFEVGAVDSHRASGRSRLVERDPARNAHLLEFAAAEIVKEEVRHGVVGHDQVDQAIAIDVVRRDAERLGHGGLQVRGADLDARPFTDVGERTAVVSKQRTE